MKAATWKYFRINQVFGTKWVTATVHSFQPAEMSETGQEYSRHSITVRRGLFV